MLGLYAWNRAGDVLAFAPPGPAGAPGLPSPPPSGAALTNESRVVAAGHGSAPAPAPIIDAIELEKEEVCEGEENLVTVRAHTPDGSDDSYLHAVIGGTAGMSVPVRGRHHVGGGTAAQLVTVFGRDNAATTVALPSFTVKDCTAPRYLLVERRLRPNSEAELEFSARLFEPGADTKLAPDHYAWDFGDGSHLETAAAYAVHDYGARRQDTLYSHFLVRAEAYGPGGDSVSGRTSVALHNTAFTNLVYAGVVTLMADLRPRFPELDEDGVVRQSVHLWHHHPNPVRVEHVHARHNFGDERASTVTEVNIAELLGTRIIPAVGITIRARLDTRREPGVISVDYEIAGKTADGIPAAGGFSIMVPPTPPSANDSMPVYDPLQRAKIRHAMTLLGKKYVTQAEIQTLELQGAFAGLEATAAPAAGAPLPRPRYGDLPAHPPRRAEPTADEPLYRADEVQPLAPAIPGTR